MRMKINSFTILVFCLIAGLAIALQISNVQYSDGIGLISVNEVKNYEEKLQEIRKEKESARQALSKIESEKMKIEEDITNESFYLKAQIADLEKYKMSAGVYDVKGPGIVITINEPDYIKEYGLEGESNILPNYHLLLGLVNYLRKSGAEAISINDQRIIATTEFNYVGDAIYINRLPTVPPYSINAIGDPDTMEPLLNIRYGILDVMRNQYGLKVHLEKREEIEMPRYYNNLNFKYAKPVEDN